MLIKKEKNHLERYYWITCLLLVFYFVSHEFNANFGVISTTIALKLLFKYILYTGLISLCAYIYFRNGQTTFLFSTLAMSQVLFFGAIHDGLRNLLPGVFSSHTVMILSCVVLLFISAIWIKKNKRRSRAFYLYLLTVVFLLALWETGSLLIHVLKGDINNLRGRNREVFLMADRNKAADPDIFFLVFDSYASSEFLRKEFGFQNPLDSMLEQRGFFVARKANSNYPITPFSIASTLEMDYLALEREDSIATSKIMLKGSAAVYRSRVPKLLRKAGYEIHNYSVFDLEKFPAESASFFESLEENLIDQQTLPGRFEKHLSWNFKISKGRDGSARASKSMLKDRDQYIEAFISSNIEWTKRAAGEKGTAPKFVYCHLMLPHEPYYFNADGTMAGDSVLMGNYGDREKRFVDQTIYCNRVIEELLEAMMENRSRPLVIIMEGDHGYRDVASKAEKDKIFQNLNAYYFSDGDYGLLYDDISPVNSFRVVWNKYFNAGVGLLKDTSIYVLDPSFKFEQ